MSRSHRTRIFISVALLTALGLVTAHGPVVARAARSDNAPQEALVEGQTFRVLLRTTCQGTEPDTWEFLVGGELVGQTIVRGVWHDLTPPDWGATVTTSCASFVIYGRSFGPMILARGLSLKGDYVMLVVGIRV